MLPSSPHLRNRSLSPGILARMGIPGESFNGDTYRSDPVDTYRCRLLDIVLKPAMFSYNAGIIPLLYFSTVTPPFNTMAIMYALYMTHFREIPILYVTLLMTVLFEP